jgi:rhodanese-related sulfurtransferase
VTGIAAPVRRSIDQVLAEARSRLRRVDPQQADAEIRAGALLVDIRPQAQRADEGGVPGALLVERNVLEWRFDPASASRLAQAGSYEVRLIVMCSEGYTSSLAAASLQDLGLVNATDLAGGFRAWAAAGLPVTGCQ